MIQNDSHDKNLRSFCGVTAVPWASLIAPRQCGSNGMPHARLTDIGLLHALIYIVSRGVGCEAVAGWWARRGD